MENRSGSTDRQVSRVTASPQRGSNAFLYGSQSLDRLSSRPTQSEHEGEGQPFDRSSIHDGPQGDDALQQNIVRSRNRSQSSADMPTSRSRPQDTQSLHGQALDRPITSTSERNQQNFSRSLYGLQSSADMTTSGSRPQDTRSLQRQSLDSSTTPTSERNPENFSRLLNRSRSSDGLTSRFVQPESRPVRQSRPLDTVDPNTTAEKRQTDLPLSHRRSSDGTFSLDAFKESANRRSSLDNTSKLYSTQSLERTPTPPSIVAESSGTRPTSSTGIPDVRLPSSTGIPDVRLPSSTELPGVRPILSSDRRRPQPREIPLPLPASTGIWTPSSVTSFRETPYKRSQSIYTGRISELSRQDDIDKITPVVPSRSHSLEILPRDRVSERESNQTSDRDALVRAFGIAEDSPLRLDFEKYAGIMLDIVKTGGSKEDLVGRLLEESIKIAQERDQADQADPVKQANNRDVETLLRSLGIRNDDLGSGNYLEAREHAQTIVRVIRTDGKDQEFNAASEALLKLAPKRFWGRSLFNPKKDTIDWYHASWKNQHEMSKLDPTTWIGSIRRRFYQANQPIAGLTNTRLGNLGFIGVQALAGTAYTSYIEKAFASSTLVSTLEYAATARFFYSLLPNPINQVVDTFQFQGVSIGLYQALLPHAANATVNAAVNATMGG